MHWYTLTPYEQQMVQDSHLLTVKRYWLTDSPLLPNGHMLVAALRTLLPNALITLRGPFLCRNHTLYFPYPLNGKANYPLMPLPWITAQTTGAICSRSLFWDKRKPAPLVAPLVAMNKPPFGFNSDVLNPNELNPNGLNPNELNPKQYDRYFLSYKTILRLMQPSSQSSQPILQKDLEDDLEDDLEMQPWMIETQWRSLENSCDRQNHTSAELIERNTIEQAIWLRPGWKLAIALDNATHRKLKKQGKILLIQLGEKSQKFWLESQNEPFHQQWNLLQEQSERNRRNAEQQQIQQSSNTRILAYLATPGVFERKQNGVATCRNFPWEWDLAYPADCNQPQGPLVSFATSHPLQIHCCCLSKTISANGVLASHVFAVPAGSVYYLQYPADLFQNQPFLNNGKPNKAHIWRQLGYSELLWMPYQNDSADGF